MPAAVRYRGGGARQRSCWSGQPRRCGRVHDRDAIGDVGNHDHVVGDQNDRSVALDGELPQKVEDLGLDGDIERRGGFVGDQDRRVGDQRGCDQDALAHAAGEFERALVDAAVRVGDADVRQHLSHGRSGAGERLTQCLGDLAADGGERVKGRLRLLEDHRHTPATYRLRGAFGDRGDVVVAETNAAASVADRRRQQAHDGLCGDRFPAAALADDGHDLAERHQKPDAVDGAADGERQIVNAEGWHGVIDRGSGARHVRAASRRTGSRKAPGRTGPHGGTPSATEDSGQQEPTAR